VTSRALRIAKRIYRGTHSLRLRQLYFNLFLRVARGRRRIVTREELTFELDLGEMIDVGLYVEEYEREVAAAIDRLCQPGWCAVDVGANVGGHTLRLAKRVGPTGSVYAFEPTHYAYRKLLRNLSLNTFTNVHAYQIALSDTDDVGRDVAIRSSWRSDGVRTETPEKVVFERLDRWCLENDVVSIQLMKVDVDGREFEVLSGGARLLAGSRPVLLMEAGSYHFKSPERNPFLLLERMGYRFSDAKSGAGFGSVRALGEALSSDRAAGIDSRNVIARWAEPA